MWWDLNTMSSSLKAGLLRGDGGEETPPVVLASYSTLVSVTVPSAVFTGSGYLLAWDSAVVGPPGAGVNTFTTRSLGLDGSPGSAQQPFPTTATDSPILTWSGTKPRVIFRSGSTFSWADLSVTGAWTESPHSIASTYNLWGVVAPIVTPAGDMLTLTGASSAGTGNMETLESVHVAGNGTLNATSPMTVTGGFAYPQLIAQGKNAFGAWLTGATPANVPIAAWTCSTSSPSPGHLSCVAGPIAGGRAVLAPVY
jgi:hypothetical protein